MGWDARTYRFIEETVLCDDCIERDPQFRADRTVYGEPLRYWMLFCERCPDDRGNATRGYRVRTPEEAEGK